MPTIPFSKKHGPRFKTGAKPTPRNVLAAARPFVPTKAAPAEFATVPQKLDPWGNQSFGDCVTAEEAFARACYDPEIFIEESVVVAWARKHGVLNGADLGNVLDMMNGDGFKVGSQRYDAGPASTVNWKDHGTLKAAIAKGPVKIAIPASCLPSGAGSQQGWYITTTRGGRTDHCVSLSGYGSAGFLFDALKVSLPSKLPRDTEGMLLYTWATIGFVTFAWTDAALDEAWLREPTTVGVPPLAPPPPPPPGPGPIPPLAGSFRIENGIIRGEASLNLPVALAGSWGWRIVPDFPGASTFHFAPSLPG